MISSIADIRQTESEAEEFNLHHGSVVFFRGQSNCVYALTPTISRTLNDLCKIQIAEKYIVNKMKETNETHEDDIRVVPSKKYQLDKWRLLFQAQHIGIPTRLLDITQSIYHAVYFSVMNTRNDTYNGELIIFYCNRELIYTDIFENNEYYLGDIDPFNLRSRIFVNGGIFIENIKEGILSDMRRYKQFGRFIVQPTESLLSPIVSDESVIIHKKTIPKEYKKKLRKELEEIGINFNTTLCRDPTQTLPIKRDIDAYLRSLKNS